MGAVELRSGGLLLVARHDPPEAPAPAAGPLAAVVCHPHPLYGGTLENKVVHGLARALREAGLHVLRFNFRGAGGSEGSHEAGAGERDDARAALDLVASLAGLTGEAAAGRLLVAGYSFGSWVGLTVALGDARVAARIAVAPPVNFYDYRAIAAAPEPLLVAYARDDEVVPAALVERFVAGCAAPTRALALPSGGHMLHGRIAALRAAVRDWLPTVVAPRES